MLIKSYIHPAVLRFARIHADVGCCSRCGIYWGGAEWAGSVSPPRACLSQPMRRTQPILLMHPGISNTFLTRTQTSLPSVASLCVFNCQTRPGTILKAHTTTFFVLNGNKKKRVYEFRQKHACSWCCCSVSNGRFNDAFLGRSQSGVAPCRMSEVTDDCKRRFSLHQVPQHTCNYVLCAFVRIQYLRAHHRHIMEREISGVWAGWFEKKTFFFMETIIYNWRVIYESWDALVGCAPPAALYFSDSSDLCRKKKQESVQLLFQQHEVVLKSFLLTHGRSDCRLRLLQEDPVQPQRHSLRFHDGV